MQPLTSQRAVEVPNSGFLWVSVLLSRLPGLHSLLFGLQRAVHLTAPMELSACWWQPVGTQ